MIAITISSQIIIKLIDQSMHRSSHLRVILFALRAKTKDSRSQIPEHDRQRLVLDGKVVVIVVDSYNYTAVAACDTRANPQMYRWLTWVKLESSYSRGPRAAVKRFAQRHRPRNPQADDRARLNWRAR